MMANWFVTKDGKQHGPFTDGQLKRLANEGRLSGTDIVRREDQQVGVEANRLRGLFDLPANNPTEPPAFVKTNIPPAPSAVPTFSPTIQAPPPIDHKIETKSARPKSRGVGIAGALLTICLLGFMLCCGFGSLAMKLGLAMKPGTITFAEEVEDRTFKTKGESNRFSTGWVWLVIRSSRPFGDGLLKIQGRIHGDKNWTDIAELKVDPKWDAAAKRELLDVGGAFDIRVTTSKGRVVAEGMVVIVDLPE